MNDKKKNTMDLSSIIGGGMKNLINSVDSSAEKEQEVVESSEYKPISSEKLREGSFVVESSRLEDNINYFLRVKKSRKQVYIDVDTLKKLEQVLLDYKYNNENVTHIPVGTLVSAILKTYFDASGI